ncbi:MAG: response regulator [Thermotaleaceae bacterium]
MKWFSRISIRNRLTAALLISIMAFIGFGIYTMIGMHELQQVTHNIYEDPLHIAYIANEVRVDMIKAQREIRELLLVEDEADIREEIESISAIHLRILNNLDRLKGEGRLEENQILAEEIRADYFTWKQKHEQVMRLVLVDNIKDAEDIILMSNRVPAERMEDKLVQIDKNVKNAASQLNERAKKIEEHLRAAGVSLMLILGSFWAVFFMLVSRSIVQPINQLKDSMNESILSGKLTQIHLSGNNEITEMARSYDVLIEKLDNAFWIKDRQNLLNQEISSAESLQELIERALRFIAREVNAGKGIFYRYDAVNQSLHLAASYAITEKEQLIREYKLGEGIPGQVALEKRAILLKNIQREESYIQTGIFREAPLNVYALPLIYEENIYGVIELASFQGFNIQKQEFLAQGAGILAINLHAAIQNQKVKDLLDISEAAQQETRHTANELTEANRILEKQRELLQQQTLKLQQSNAELEEQQQQLQQQSEILYLTNSQLEEQQQLMEEQSRLLSIKNKELEASRMELLERSKQLEISNRYKSEFLANMSHELRTPLNAIILLSKLMAKNEGKLLDEAHLEKIEIIYRSGRELLRLINDILDLSKIEAGKMELYRVSFRTQELIDELEQFFQASAKEKQLAFIIEDSVNATLFGDRYKISQILRNLISNAIKFTEKGSVTLYITYDQEVEEGVLFSVKDTGIGIKKENIDRIFQSFQQEDGSTSRKFGGTGLGLSISKKMIDLMGGKIRVNSKDGEGSTFTLYLPNMLNAKKETYVHKEYLQSLEEVAATSTETIGLLQPKKVILVIEDDEIFAQQLHRIIEGMGFDSVLATTGEEGLVCARKYMIDGILLDLILPDISGVEVLRELKSTAELRNIPIQVISAKEKNNKLQKMGAVGYQQKPIAEEDISETVLKMLAITDKKKKRVLLIEDNPKLKNATEALIIQGDMEIKTVETAEKAKLQIQKGAYDMIVLNVELEGGKGAEICKYIQEKGLEVPIVVYTGKPLTPKQEKEINQYADSLIVKTADSGERLQDEVALFLHQVKKKEEKKSLFLSKTSMEYNLQLNGVRILIADDDLRNIFVLASALEDYGAEILEAENGEEALEILQKEQVDLVLMDVMMPKMDGLEAIKRIRRDERLNHLPIIAITAKALKEDRQKCMEAGANDYISKPIDYDILIRVIKAWLKK